MESWQKDLGSKSLVPERFTFFAALGHCYLLTKYNNFIITEYNREEREIEKMRKKETWFRSSTCGIQPETVLFVTATPNSELCNNIKERLRMSKIPVRVAEKAGVKLCHLLMRTNPHKQMTCNRLDCMPCTTRDEEDKGSSNCEKEGVTYSLQCQHCPSEDQAVYIGESSTTGYIQGKQHMAQYKYHSRGSESGKDSVLGRHVVEYHGGDHNIKFKMVVTSHHPSRTHTRQIEEAARIKLCKSSSLINGRDERDSDLVSNRT